MRPFGIPKKSSQAETLVSKIFIRNKWKETWTDLWVSDQSPSTNLGAMNSQSFRAPRALCQPRRNHWHSEPPGLPVIVTLHMDIYFHIGNNAKRYIYISFFSVVCWVVCFSTLSQKNSLNKMCVIKLWSCHFMSTHAVSAKSIPKCKNFIWNVFSTYPCCLRMPQSISREIAIDKVMRI